MLLWRISNHTNLDGLGGERLTGRWHTAAPGKRIVYLSEHPAVCLVESLANLSGHPDQLPDRFQLLKVIDETAISPAELTPSQRAAIDPQHPTSTQAMGDEWLHGHTSLLLRVPSMPSPESWNYLLNPLHPDASLLRVEWARHIAYDKRLFHLAQP